MPGIVALLGRGNRKRRCSIVWPRIASRLDTPTGLGGIENTKLSAGIVSVTADNPSSKGNTKRRARERDTGHRRPADSGRASES